MLVADPADAHQDENALSQVVLGEIGEYYLNTSPDHVSYLS